MSTSTSAPVALPFPAVFVPGAEPALVFCHGYSNTYNGPMALAVQQYAEECGRAFVRFEYRHIWDEGRAHDIQTWVDDLLAVLDRFEKPSIVMGYSMGSVAAMGAASLRPDKVHSMVLLCPPLVPTTEESIEGVCRLDKTFEDKLRAGETILMQHRPGGWPNYVSTASFDAINRYNPLYRLFTEKRRFPVECPVRFVNGLLDTTAHYATTCTIAQECLASRDVEVVLLKNRGHELIFLPAIRRVLDWALEDAASQEQS